MALVPATCLSCGGNIMVDPNTKTGICECCGRPYITEEVINNYNTYISNVTNIGKIENATFDVNNVQSKVESAETFLVGLKDYRKAEEIYCEVLKDAPGNYQAHYGLARVATNDLNAEKINKDVYPGYYKTVDSNINKAVAFAPVDKKEEIKRRYKQFLSGAKGSYERHKNTLQDKKSATEDDLKNKQRIASKINELSQELNRLSSEENKAYAKRAEGQNIIAKEKQNKGNGCLYVAIGFILFSFFLATEIAEKMSMLAFIAVIIGIFLAKKSLTISRGQKIVNDAEAQLSIIKNNQNKVQQEMDRISGIENCDNYKMQNAISQCTSRLNMTIEDISRIEKVIIELSELDRSFI